MSTQVIQGLAGNEMVKRRGPIHTGKPGDVPHDAPYEAQKVEFARRLQAAMIDKGWHQSELARQSSKFAHKGDEITRDRISKYIRAIALPNPTTLAALAKALGKSPDDLLPSRGVSLGSDHPPFDMRGLNDGNVWLRVNQAVPMDVGLKIMELLRGSKK